MLELLTKRWWVPALLVVVIGGGLLWFALSTADPAPLAYPHTK